MSEWKIEYDNDTGGDDGGFWEWWTVSDGVKSFKCDSEEDAKMLLATLQSNAQAKASEWQPISTAPRDKTTVVLLRCNEDGSVTYGHGFYMPLDGWFGWTHYAHKPPTHWMPLPAPPKSTCESA